MDEPTPNWNQPALEETDKYHFSRAVWRWLTTTFENIWAALDALAALIAAIPTIATGTYTPTLTNVTNLDASTASSLRYLRVGNTCRVWGQVAMDPTAAGAVVMQMSLPLPADLPNVRSLTGVGLTKAGDAIASIFAVAAADVAEFQWTAVATTNQTFYFGFDYGPVT